VEPAVSILETLDQLNVLAKDWIVTIVGPNDEADRWCLTITSKRFHSSHKYLGTFPAIVARAHAGDRGDS
jgi:hypothetical protein